MASQFRFSGEGIGMGNAKVAIAAIVGVTIVVLALIAGLVILAADGANATTLLSLVSTLVGTLNMIMLVQTRTSVAQLKEQTNGTQTTLINAAIAAPSNPAIIENGK